MEEGTSIEKMVQSEDKFRMKDALKNWVFWVGWVMVLGAMVIAISQLGVGNLTGTALNWATALLLVGTFVVLLGIFLASIKANRIL